MSQTDPNQPPGRSLSLPEAAEFKAELMAFDKRVPVEVLTMAGDPEAKAFAEEIAALLKRPKRKVTVRPVNFDPPFRGMQIYEGEDKIQISIGHSMTHGPSFLWPLRRS